MAGNWSGRDRGVINLGMVLGLLQPRQPCIGKSSSPFVICLNNCQ